MNLIIYLATFITHMESRGTVSIARLNGKGKPWPSAPAGFKNINVTSGSQNKIEGVKMKDMSPMFLGPVNQEVWPMMLDSDQESLIFENYWQASV